MKRVLYYFGIRRGKDYPIGGSGGYIDCCSRFGPGGLIGVITR